MGFLDGKRVLLGVTGSIAAYKSAFIVREFIKAGAGVQVILTPSARQFVTPLTLGTLSKNPVLDALVKDGALGVWNNHVELGLWADLFLVAPASANTIAKMAHGEADNLLLTTYLSARCPVYFAPAMDVDMHAHQANQDNIETLVNRGNILIPAESGELASGLEGQGRLAEPAHIISFIESDLGSKAPLQGKTILITAGPTYEPIDPVRFIGNRSSGKMGYAIARRAMELGARVQLISGPVHVDAPKGVELVRVETAAEMYTETINRFSACDVAVLSAAVADYRPVNPADQKIKKKESSMTLDLEKTKDILSSLGKAKTHQFLVGFALETSDEIANAIGKLEAKNCDMIVLNSLRDSGAGFGYDTNQVTLIERNKTRTFELKSKEAVADDILQAIMIKIL